MPRAQRHALMVSVLAKTVLEQAAGGLIRVWLVKGQRAMLVDFLTALGIPHNEGVVDDLPAAMDDAKLKTAVDTCSRNIRRKPWPSICTPSTT